MAPSIGVMAYDEEIADRIRELLAEEQSLTEKKMFGGLAFLVNGYMAVAASGQGGILVRSDPKEAMPVGAQPAIMRGRPMDGWLRVAAERLQANAQLAQWVRIGATHARSLPPKTQRRTKGGGQHSQEPSTRRARAERGSGAALRLP